MARLNAAPRSQAPHADGGRSTLDPAARAISARLDEAEAHLSRARDHLGVLAERAVRNDSVLKTVAHRAVSLAERAPAIERSAPGRRFTTARTWRRGGTPHGTCTGS